MGFSRQEYWSGVPLPSLEVQTTIYKMNKLQGYTVQHRNYSQYFKITLNGIYSIKILNHYVVHFNNVNQLYFNKNEKK